MKARHSPIQPKPRCGKRRCSAPGGIQIQQHPDVPPTGLEREHVEVIQCAERRINRHRRDRCGRRVGHSLGRTLTTRRPGRSSSGVEGVEQDRVDSQSAQVVQVFDDALQAGDAVCILRRKRTCIDLVDDRVPPPGLGRQPRALPAGSSKHLRLGPRTDSDAGTNTAGNKRSRRDHQRDAHLYPAAVPCEDHAIQSTEDARDFHSIELASCERQYRRTFAQASTIVPLHLLGCTNLIGTRGG